MPWSGTAGSETFSRTDGTRTGSTTWQDAEAASVDIVSDDHDTHDQDVADGVNACFKKDGGNTATANLPMGGFKFTGLGAGSANGNSVRYEQVIGVLNAPSSTAMFFAQAAAPTGWTQSVANDDMMVGLVDDTTGGTTGGSWTVSGLSADAHALTAGEIPVNTTSASAVDASGGSPDIANLWQGTTTASGHTHTISSTGAWRPSTMYTMLATKD